MTLRGKLAEVAHKSEESKLRGSALAIAEKESEGASKLRINFKTNESEEEKLLGKWAYMNVAEDGKGVEIFDKDGESLGRIRRHNEADVAGDNYFLETSDMTVVGHKEEKGWTLYDVTNRGYSTVKIENEQRTKALKPLFHEARLAMNYPGGSRSRVNPMGMTSKTR